MSTFLVDECVSSQTIQLIKSLGFSVESLQEFGKCGAKDEEVLRLAQERKSILVTYDVGFGDITKYRSYSTVASSLSKRTIVSPSSNATRCWRSF
jgi:predicted nuclease of predicted toxin-antitoxin system